MKTKKVYYYVDLTPNWHNQNDTSWNSTPFLNNKPFNYEKAAGQRRIKVCVELPVFGDEVDGFVEANSKEMTSGFTPPLS